MTMKTQYAKRILAIAVALVMLLGTLFTGVVSSLAASLTDGLTNIATTDTNGNKYTGYSTVTDITGGGIKFSTNIQNGSLSPYAHSENAGAFPGDGIRLQFSNYTTSSEYSAHDNYQKFMVVLAKNVGSNQGDYYRLRPGVAAILFDTKAGTLSLIKGTSVNINAYSIITTFATDEALKYENISNKPFTLDFAGGKNGSVDVAVTVGDDYVYGNITAEQLNEFATAYKPTNDANNKTYFTISTATVSNSSQNAHSTSTLNYYGFKKGGVTVTPAEIPLSNGLTDVASVAKNGYSSSSGVSAISNISSGGISYSTNGSGAYRPYVHNVGVVGFPGGGVTLQFDGFRCTSNASTAGTRGYQTMLITLASSVTDGGESARLRSPKAAGFIIDAHNGNVDYVAGVAGNQASHTVIQNVISNNDLIKYANIENSPFTVTFKYNENADVIVEVNVTGNNESGTASGVLSGSNLAKVYNVHSTKTYFSVSSLDCNNNPGHKISFNYYGYKELAKLPAFAEGLTDVATSGDMDGYALTSAKNWGVSGFMSGGGFHFNMFQHAGLGPAAYKTANLGGYNGNWELLFANYFAGGDATDYGYGKFAINLYSGTENRMVPNAIALAFDTVAGTLSLVQVAANAGTNGDGRLAAQIVNLKTLITNDALKHQNLLGKVFKVRWTQKSDTEIKVSVVIDSNEYSGDFEKSLLDTRQSTSTYHGITAATGYVSLSNLYSSTSSTAGQTQTDFQLQIDLYGYKNMGTSPSVFGLTEGLTDIATVEKNLEKRTDIVTQSDILGGGTVLYWDKYSGYAPYRHNSNIGGFCGDGIRFQLANYRIDDTTAANAKGRGLIGIVLSNTTVNDKTKPKDGLPIIMIDTNNGTLNLVHMPDDKLGAEGDPVVDQLIATDNKLKYAYISGKPFSVIIKPTADGANYVVSVDFGNDIVVSGTMKRDIFYSDITRTYAPNAIQTFVGIGGFTNGVSNKWSIEYYGYEVIEIKAPVIDVSQLTETASSTVDLYPRPALKEVTDLEKGGVSINFKGANGGYVPYSYNVNLGKFPGDYGFKLQFSNYINVATKTEANANYYGQIAIVLSNTTNQDRTKAKKGVAFLQIDTVNGKLLLRYCNNGNWGNPEQNSTEIGFTTVAELLTSDLLKYENFSRKAFSLTFKDSATSEGDVDIIIEVGGDGNTVKGETVTAVLDMEVFNSILYRAGASTYISVGGFDNDEKVSNPFYLEFYGYQNFGVRRDDVTIKGDVAAVNTAIAALPATATLADAEAILSAKAKYDSLADKSAVRDADKLNALIAELNTLRNASKVKPTSTFLAREADSSLGFAEFGNPHARTLFSKATDKGFKIDWRGSTGGVSGHETLMSQSIYGAYKLDGMRVHIDDYTFDETKGSDFWVQFTSGDYDDFWNQTGEHADKTIAIRLGLLKGRLEINGVGSANTWIAGDSAILHRDNLKDKDFIVEWKKQSNGDYICYITIGEQVVAFTLSAAELAKMPNFDENEVRVIIGNADAKAIFSMEVTGIYSAIDAAAQTVINKINNLPANVASANDVAAVKAVVTAYNALSVAEKEQIYNVDALTAARAAVRKYEGVDEKGKDKNGYYIPNALTDVYGDTSKDSVFARITDSKLGGLLVEWNGEGYGKKNCFADHYVMDGISVRFDNWKYVNDGAFIVGFENSTQECKVFDRKQFDTRNGIWLTIGRDNTIYSTYANKDVNGVFPLFEPNELLSAQNLMNKEFFVSWKVIYNDNGSTNLQVTFTVDGKDFTYTYDKAYMDALDLMDIEDIQVVTHCISGNNHKGEGGIRTNLLTAASIDITGLKFEEFSSAQKALIQEVIDAIDALPEKATAEIADTIDDIWNMCYELSFTEMRLAVTNHSKLVKLYNELFDMQLADGTMYLDPEAEEDEYLEEDSDEEYDGTVDEDYDAEYEDEPEEETEDEQTSTKKPTKVTKDEDDASFPWIILVIGGIILLAVIAIVIILIARKNKEKEGK